MRQGRIIVDAMWDNEAGVFVATSQDVPGLVAEAESFEALAEKLNVLIPELLAQNFPSSAPFDPFDEAALVIMAERRGTVRRQAFA